ncbi:hypothetical protein ABEB36_001475 [Hypothenemus hampei]|uniref:Uncharacterized protein n=1 Tax=Hypothenemus hampei TaxID=57062 RepID=A0ABD1FEN7_HYPHA
MYENKGFFVFLLSLITFGLLHIDPANGVIKCYQCDSNQDRGCEEAVNPVSHHATDCNGDEGCLLYIMKENVTSPRYVRECKTTEKNCETISTDNLLSCRSCETEACNEKIETMGKFSCIECSSENKEECQSDDVPNNTSLTTCILDEIVNPECVSYITINDDKSIVTKRGCAAEKFCDDVDEDKKLYCETCNNNDKCNSKIDKTKEKVICIQCQGDSKSECANDISTLTNVDLVTIDPNTNVCVTIQYYQGTDLLTYRGTEEKGFCDKPGSNVTLCDFCSTEECNTKISENVINYNVCIQCDSDDCAADNLPDEKVTGYCHREDNQVCVTSRSQKDGTKRGCQTMGKCTEMYDENQSDLEFCTECSEGQLCNKVVDTSKTCYSCNAETDENCSEELKDESSTCILDSVKTGCVVYQYTKEADNKTITARECLTEKHNCTTIYNTDHKSDLLLCNECNSTNCNSNIHTTDTRISCVQCSSEDGDECSKDSVTEDIGTCIVDNTVHPICVAYRSVGDDNSYVTERGCKNENFCDSLDKEHTLYCEICLDDNNCNSIIDETKEKMGCIKCEGDQNTECGHDTISDLNNMEIFSFYPTENECITVKYYKGDQLYTDRGVKEIGFCDNQEDNVALCDSCTTDKCNQQINKSAKKYNVCVQCNGANCAEDNMSTENITDYCHLKENEVCVTSRSLKDGTFTTNRGCQVQNECVNMYGNNTDLQFCTECSEGQLCNKVVDTSKTCYSCNAETDENCSEELKDESSTCILDSVKTGCIVYQYTKKADNKTITARECLTEKHNCATIYNTDHKSDLLLCNECSSTNCNSGIYTTDTRKPCIQCSSETDGACSQYDVKEDIGTCIVDDVVNPSCVSYQIISDDKSYVTERGCKQENFCDGLDKKNTLYCKTCSGDKCNSQINATQLNIGCVQCQGDSESECAKDISILTNVDLVSVDPNTNACVTIQYYQGSQLLTYRDVVEKDFCNKAESNISVCDSCSTDQCNKKIRENAEKYNVCVQCDGANCTANELSDDKINDYCHREDNQVCVTSRSQKDGTKRGCQTMGKCTEMYDENQSDLEFCTECSEGQLCNKVVDTSKTCYSCNAETDENCSEELKDESSTCILDSVKTGCIVYQYTKKADNKTITARECLTEKHNCATIYNTDHKSDLLLCNECSSTNCNSGIDTVDNRTSCIQCSSEDGDECSQFNITENIGSCTIDDVVHPKCVAYRYVDKTTATYNIYRGCDENTCNDANKNLTTGCLSCSNNDDCISKLNKAVNKLLCIECDETDEKCGEQKLTEVTKVCKLDDNTQCVTHKYLDGADVKAIRGCLETNYCNVTASVNSSSTLCVSCDGEICNKEYNVTEKTLCAKCSGDGCPEKLDAAKVQSYCALDDSTECIAYKYTDSSTEKDIIVRDCVKKDSENCDAKLKDNSLGGSLRTCLTCRDSNLCNLKTNSTEINGASSMITLNTAVVPLIVMIVAKMVV